jgi:hypothetical protein
VQLPGSYNTVGTASFYGNVGTYQAATTYQPGPMLVTGGHHEDIAIKMFKPADPGFDQAIDAKSALGPKWQQIARDGVITCAG